MSHILNIDNNDGVIDVDQRAPLPVVAPTLSAAERFPEVSPIPFSEAMRLGIDEQSIFGSVSRFIKRREALEDIAVPENYDVTLDPQVKGMPQLLPFVATSDSPQETTLRLQQLIDLQSVGEVLDDAGIGGTGGRVVGGILNPSSVLTGAALGRLALLGIKSKKVLPNVLTGRTAQGVAGGLALGVTEEAILSSQTPTRTVAESLTAIGVIAGAGGIFGALSRPARFTQTSRLNSELEPGVSVKFENTTLPNERYQGYEVRPQSVGAASTPNVSRSFADRLEGEGLVETGIGIEKLPMNPNLRLKASPSAVSRETVPLMTDLGGLLTKDNVAGRATRRSVETNRRINWTKPFVDALVGTDDAYLRYAGIEPKPGDLGRTAQVLGEAGHVFGARALGTGSTRLSPGEFRIEVGKAMRRGDRHEIPEVAEVASLYRNRVSNPLKEAAQEEGLFVREMKREFAGLQKTLDNLAASAKTADVIAKRATEARMAALQEKIKKLEQFGPTTNTAESFFPRIYRHDRILANRDAFSEILFNHFRRKASRDKTDADIRKDVEETVSTILNERPALHTLDEDFNVSSNLRERTLDIDDNLIEGFLESNVEIVFRAYNRSVSTDIELSRQFSDISMTAEIQSVKDEFARLIEAASTPEAKAKLRNAKARDIRDIRALRDRLRGSYGAPSDPFRPVSRFIRTAKSFNALTMLGGATISSIPDMARAVMTEGLNETLGGTYQALFTENAKLIRSMSRKELRMAGEALDMIEGTRAMMMADIGDTFGKETVLERGLLRGNGLFFMANGLNVWNTAMKEWVGVVISMRMNESISRLARGTASGPDITKLARSGIDADMAARMQAQISRHGETTDGFRMPNTEAWDDLEAVQSYRAALSQDVNRTIVTPGIGDRALWTTTELGGMITQFKSFAQASHVRVLTSGLQEKDKNFWLGATMIVALGGVVNEIKETLRGDTREKGTAESIIDAIDRSGLPGIMSDIDYGIEVLSDRRAGLRPLFGAPGPRASTNAVLGVLGGPTATNMNRFRDVIGDLLSFNADERTVEQAQRLIPGNNLPYLKPLLDEIRENSGKPLLPTKEEMRQAEGAANRTRSVL